MSLIRDGIWLINEQQPILAYTLNITCRIHLGTEMSLDKIEEQIDHQEKNVKELQQKTNDVEHNCYCLRNERANLTRSLATQKKLIRELNKAASTLSAPRQDGPAAQTVAILESSDLAESLFLAQTKQQKISAELILVSEKLLSAENKLNELSHELAREKTVLQQKTKEKEKLVAQAMPPPLQKRVHAGARGLR